MEGDLRNSNPEQNLFTKRRKNIRASLHKLKPQVECSKGILELRGVILASDSHFRTAVPVDAHTRWVLYDGMDEDVLIHQNGSSLDVAFEVMDYPIIQLVQSTDQHTPDQSGMHFRG
jgi:hypothetical protein